MSCGTQQVRLNRQYDARLRRSIEQISQEIEQVNANSITSDRIWKDLSTVTGTPATITITSTLSAPTASSQRLIRGIEKSNTATIVNWKLVFNPKAISGPERPIQAVETTTLTGANHAGNLLVAEAGKWDGGFRWYFLNNNFEL